MPRKPRLARAAALGAYVRVATYTRRSTDEENQPFTIEAQESKLDAYATSQDGWVIVARYTDDASGAKLERPDLNRAIAAARAGKFDVLLVYRVDRFSRRIRDLVVLLDELDQAGVVFRSATEPFDTSTPAGRMLVQMLGVFAEFEREMIIDRVVNGMERKAAKGQWTLGVAPYGYRVEPGTQHLVPVDDELVIVKEIFRLYTRKRLGTRAIANELSRRGHRRRSGRPWSFKTVTDALLNPAYIGTVAFRDIYAEDAHPAAIERDTFSEADRILTERGENPAKAAGAASDYRMTGKLTCPRCGKTYLGTTATGRNRTYRYYTCFTRNRYGTSHCDAPRIEADAFDDIVLRAVGDFYRNGTPYIAEAIAAAQREYETNKAVVESELTAVTSQMSQVEASVDRYFGDYETGKIEKGLLERRIEKLGEDLRTLRRRRDELRLQLDDVPVPLAPEDLAALQRHIDGIIDHGTSQERKSLCEAAIDKIEIDLKASKAIPIFRCNLTPPRDPANANGAPTRTLVGAHNSSSRGVRERIPPVETRGLEPLTPTLPVS
jgi:site-specific DNA recombinase